MGAHPLRSEVVDGHNLPHISFLVVERYPPGGPSVKTVVMLFLPSIDSSDNVHNFVRCDGLLHSLGEGWLNMSRTSCIGLWDM